HNYIINYIISIVINYIGEGSKPIFDREEIKKATKINEIEERHTAAIDGEQQSDSTDKSQTSSLLSSILYDSEYLSFDQFSPKSHTRSLMEENLTATDIVIDRVNILVKEKTEIEIVTDPENEEEIKIEIETNPENEEETEIEIETNPENEEETEIEIETDLENEKILHRIMSSHQYTCQTEIEIETNPKNEKMLHRIMSSHQYTCLNLPPSPIVVSPMVPFRGQVPLWQEGRHSALMAPVRPFPPWFIPPDMYRLRPPPPNPRYGPF
ncbi:LOW QUALITY PROTEIN: probable inactive protein kinase DDB_G0270444, partial [Camponotus floridanus]|uniref:LOW QUALITY PROTEIN: probable inactive protein kinase DDB_G0270444 n=1 Tax=Camponotus floridanus TaxID=104421 RepID=UPI000DC684C7